MAFRSSVRKTALPIPHGFIHDEWLALVAAALGKVTCINRRLVRYRQHPGQAIGPAAGRLFAQLRYARDQMGAIFSCGWPNARADCTNAFRCMPTCCDTRRACRWSPRSSCTLRHASKSRDQTLIRWPLAIGEAVRGRYQRFGYGFKSFLQDLVL